LLVVHPKAHESLCLSVFLAVSSLYVPRHSTHDLPSKNIPKRDEHAKISDLTVRSLQPGLYFDTKTRGFGIRVGKNRRTWIVLQGQKSAKVRLGHYPALSLADARKRAMIALGTPYQPSIAPSFIDAREQYLNTGKWRPRFEYQITRWLRLYFDWTKPVDQITPNDVILAIERIKKPSEANHSFQSIRAFFAWCTPRYLKHSPCFGLKGPPKSISRTRVLDDEEIGRIWRACDGMGALTRVGSVHTAPAELHHLPASYCQIVKLLLLTGQRRGEIAGLRPSWIRDDQITLPKEIAKNGRQHTVPIGPTAQNIIQQAQLPFTSRGTKTFNNWTYNKSVLDTLSGVTGWTLHDCRRTVASNMGALGVRLEVIERILNHVSGSFGGVAGTYQRYGFLPEMRAALELWEAKLLTLIE
jgi:integrase